MAILSQTFNLNDLPQETGGSFEPLPAGWYDANITGAELRNTKSGTGQFIAIKYTVTGPTHQGRVVFGNVNIKNDSAKAEEIGRAQLGSIMRSVGLAKIGDTNVLIGKSIGVKLKIQKDEQYGDRNEVAGFRAIESHMPIPSSAAPSVEAPKKAAPPWER